MVVRSRFEIPLSGSEKVTWISKFCQIRDISIAYVDLTAWGEIENLASQWLNTEERKRLKRFHYDKPRNDFVLCRSALRRLICDYLGCENEQLSFDYNDHGKPIPLLGDIPASVSVNLSHSGDYGLIGIAEKGELGVDIEVRMNRTDLDGIGQMVFTPNELSELEQAVDDEKKYLFYKLWTLKEALIKGLGTGFSLNPSLFEIPSVLRSGSKNGVFFFPHITHLAWHLEYIDDEDFALSIAHGREFS